ncbi:MAG: hypothetical protein JWQ07_259 [Ramlibacter sp.]|nr:hypothetical protein [Ramlibacter sp.]
MNPTQGNAGTDPTRPIVTAKAKTDSVQEELAVASAELQLTNTALEQILPPGQKQGDVRKALDQNERIEEKVTQAAEELAEVSDLLAEEIVQRHRLEQELARRTP